MGLGPFPVLAKCSRRAEWTCPGLLGTCHLELSEPVPALETGMWFAHVKECVAGELFVVFVSLLLVAAFVFLRINFRLVGKG